MFKKSSQTPLPDLIPEGERAQFVAYFDHWWLQKFVCQHHYDLVLYVMRAPNQLLGLPETYLEVWRCRGCGKIVRRNQRRF